MSFLMEGRIPQELVKKTFKGLCSCQNQGQLTFLFDEGTKD